MSKKSKKKLKINKRSIVITILVVVLLVAAAGVGVLVQFLQRQTTQNQQGIEGDANDFTISGGPPLPKAVLDSQNLAVQGKTEEANKKINEALQKSPNDETKYELYVQLGINEQNAGKYDAALAEYRKAEAIKQDFKIVKLIASVAEVMGNKTLAIEYYQKAIPLIDPENARKDAEKRLLEAKLRELGA